MGSSFLTTIYLGLALYSVILFIKLVVQFGLPNHPSRFTMYLVSLSATSYFCMKALTSIGVVPPFAFINWGVIPLIAGSLALLLQVITIVGRFSYNQQKNISRMPVMASLVVFAFFPDKAYFLFALCIIACGIFLTVSVGKAIYQKRVFFKLSVFLLMFGALSIVNYYPLYVAGQLLLFPCLFYFFIFQQTFGISAMVEQFQSESSGVSS